jgi:hypothetical protein
MGSNSANWNTLPTLAEMQAKARACPKGPSRLERALAQRQLATTNAKAFRKVVIARDGNICRCCGRKVIPTLSHVPERREVHHIHGRRGDLRHEPRAALILCCACHEKVSGAVNVKFVIMATKTFRIRNREYTDARHPLKFRKVA